jgi:hypothetical protein
MKKPWVFPGLFYCASSELADAKRPPTEAALIVPNEFAAIAFIQTNGPVLPSVIVWIGNDAPSKLSNCAVRDALNWRCANRDKQGGAVEQSMANGQLTETVDGYPSPSLTVFYQTSRGRWWLVKLLETAGLRK